MYPAVCSFLAVHCALNLALTDTYLTLWAFKKSALLLLMIMMQCYQRPSVQRRMMRLSKTVEFSRALGPIWH